MKSSFQLKAASWLLALFSCALKAELVLDNGFTLQNGDFPFHTYNYTCYGNFVVASFNSSSKCQIETESFTPGCIVVVPWKLVATPAGCNFFMDFLSQVNVEGVAQPCAFVYISTVNGDVGDYDNDPFGYNSGPLKNPSFPLTLVSSSQGALLLTKLNSTTIGSVTSQPSPFTLLFSSSGFQAMRWIFFSAFLVLGSYSFVSLIISLPIPFIQVHPYGLPRVVVFSFMSWYSLIRLIEYGMDPEGSTGNEPKIARVFLSWTTFYAAYSSAAVVLLTWMALCQKLGGFHGVKNLNAIFIWCVRITFVLFLPTIALTTAHSVYPSLSIPTTTFECIIVALCAFMITLFFAYGWRLLAHLKISLAVQTMRDRERRNLSVHYKVTVLTLGTNFIFLLYIVVEILVVIFGTIAQSITIFLANRALENIAGVLLISFTFIALNAPSLKRTSKEDSRSSATDEKRPSSQGERTTVDTPPEIKQMLESIDMSSETNLEV